MAVQSLTKEENVQRRKDTKISENENKNKRKKHKSKQNKK
jgi:hypothetical protein